MNYLVFLDARAGELEKILSGLKTMLVKEFDPARVPLHPVRPGDSLYFLRGPEDCTVRVKATVVRVLSCTRPFGGDLTPTLKEMQPRLRCTEEQYNFWSGKEHVLLVEFAAAQKIGAIQIAPHAITGRTDWMAFEALGQIVK